MKKVLFILCLFGFSLISFSQETKNHTPFDPSVFEEGISSIDVFFRESCSRCPTIKQYLDSKGISYVAYDAEDEEISRYIDKRVGESLPEPGMGYSIGYPIIEINKKVLYFKIPNYVEFVDALSVFLENQNKKE